MRKLTDLSLPHWAVVRANVLTYVKLLQIYVNIDVQNEYIKVVDEYM